MNADVVAKYILRRVLVRCRIESEPQSSLDLIQEALCRPVLSGKEMFQPCSVAALSQTLLIAKDCRNCLCYIYRLRNGDESIEGNGEMWIARKTSSHADGIPNLTAPSYRRERNVIDLRIRAPYRAARCRHLEFARKIVELRICDQ